MQFFTSPQKKRCFQVKGVRQKKKKNNPLILHIRLLSMLQIEKVRRLKTMMMMMLLLMTMRNTSASFNTTFRRVGRVLSPTTMSASMHNSLNRTSTLGDWMPNLQHIQTKKKKRKKKRASTYKIQERKTASRFM